MLHRVTILEFERGLQLRNGRIVRVLAPGTHWVLGRVERADLRLRSVEVDAGGVRTREEIPVGVAARITYRLTDPAAAFVRVRSVAAQLQADARAAIVRTMASAVVGALAREHLRLEQQVQDRLSLDAHAYGTRVEDVAILPIRYPRALRRRWKQGEAPRVEMGL